MIIRQTHEAKRREDTNYILHENEPVYTGTGTGWLSVKTFFHGQALYKVDRGYHAVDETSYFILNHAQPYSITIESLVPVESFCIFFAPGFAEETYRSLTTPTVHLLDEPQSNPNGALHFFERTYPHDKIVSPTLLQLRASFLRKQDTLELLEEQFYTIMQQLLLVHKNVYTDIERIPAIRIATREELYRRLYCARDYIIALSDQPISLTEMANVACLSPNHFLRTFKHVFHQTPHQYLISERLERAKGLLLHTKDSITTICFAVGFESLGSFSWLFRQRIGCSPEEYRRQNSDFREA